MFIENKIVADSLDWKNVYDTTFHYYSSIKNKYQSGEYEANDLLPSINLTYSLTDKMNIRASYYRTLSRPAFREIAPYAFYDYQKGDRWVGNPDLNRSLANNFDLRWELFMRPGEMVSVSGFYKKLFDPIEVYSEEITQNPEYHFRNGNDGDVYGAEFEFRKQLDFIGFLKDFMLGANVTYIYSKVDEDAERVENARLNDPGFEDTRPMFGQAPYVINSYLMYDNQKLDLEANVSFNVSGPKLIIIEQGSTPNVYEMPRPDLRFNISKGFAKNFNVKFGVKNILDSEYAISYLHHSGDEYNFIKYKSGIEYSFGISYEIR